MMMAWSKEAGLGRADDVLEKRLDPIDNCLSDNFVGSITKPNRSEVLKVGSIPTLRDET